MIELKNISFNLAKNRIFRDFSLSIPAGQTTAVLGASGSGKTTLLRLIAGLETPLEGFIYIHGRAVSGAGQIIVPPYRRELGFIFQDLALWPHMTIRQNLAFVLRYTDRSNIPSSEKRIDELLTLFRIGDLASRYPHQLSGGQQQLVAIARALAPQPRILLMDEPLANLDVLRKQKILNHLKKIIQEFSLTGVYVTHDHREAFALANHIIILQDGQVVARGHPEQIKTSDNPYVKALVEY